MPSPDLLMETLAPSPTAEAASAGPALLNDDPATHNAAETRREDKNKLLLTLLRALAAWTT